MFNIMKNKSAAMSLPKSKTVHGIEVRKVPIGKYIEAMREMEELPAQLIPALFGEDATVSDIITMLTKLTADGMLKLLGKLLVISPEYLINALASILGIDKGALMELTPNEVWDVGQAYWEMNDMTDFFGRVSGLIREKLPTLIDGYKNGSPLPKAPESVSKPSSKTTTSMSS